jgi:hypothetical protein
MKTLSALLQSLNMQVKLTKLKIYYTRITLNINLGLLYVYDNVVILQQILSCRGIKLRINPNNSLNYVS